MDGEILGNYTNKKQNNLTISSKSIHIQNITKIKVLDNNLVKIREKNKLELRKSKIEFKLNYKRFKSQILNNELEIDIDSLNISENFKKLNFKMLFVSLYLFYQQLDSSDLIISCLESNIVDNVKFALYFLKTALDCETSNNNDISSYNTDTSDNSLIIRYYNFINSNINIIRLLLINLITFSDDISITVILFIYFKSTVLYILINSTYYSTNFSSDLYNTICSFEVLDFMSKNLLKHKCDDIVCDAIVLLANCLGDENKDNMYLISNKEFKIIDKILELLKSYELHTYLLDNLIRFFLNYCKMEVILNMDHMYEIIAFFGNLIYLTNTEYIRSGIAGLKSISNIVHKNSDILLNKIQKTGAILRIMKLNLDDFEISTLNNILIIIGNLLSGDDYIVNVKFN